MNIFQYFLIVEKAREVLTSNVLPDVTGVTNVMELLLSQKTEERGLRMRNKIERVL